jgi:hypothetical protein
MTTKERILDVIQRLPDETSFDQAIYELQVVREVELGLEEADRGEGVPQEEVERMFGGGRSTNGNR